MRKTFTLLLVLLGLLIPLNPQLFAQTAPVISDPPLDFINLSKSEVTLSCPPRALNKSEECPNDTVVEGKVFYPTTKPKLEDIKITTTGGKITKSDKKIEWDLSGIKPGSYKISVQVEGESQTKTVTAKQCIYCFYGDCNCPSSITILGPKEQTKAGDTLAFTANVSGGSQDKVTFNWTVTEGEIVEGQGTSTILVKTTNEMKGHTITANVEVGGFCVSCPNTASASAEVKDKDK